MASVEDLVIAVKRVGAYELGKRVYHQMSEDSLTVWAAAMAYSWLFAVFPFLIFLMSLLPYLPANMKDRVAPQIEIELHERLPTDSAVALWNNVGDVLSRPRAGVLSAGGIALTLFAASGGMSMTIAAVQRCYEILRGRAFWKGRLLSIGLTLIVVTLLLAVLILLPVSTAVAEWAKTKSLPLGWIVSITRWIVAAGLGVPLLLAGHYIGKHGRYYKLVLAGTTVLVLLLLLLVLAPVNDLIVSLLERYTGLSESTSIPLWKVAFLFWIFNLVRWALALLFMFMVVAVIYHFGPGVRQFIRIFSPGSVFAVLTWVLLGLGFRYYVNAFAHESYNRTYGTVGGVVILVLLFYLNALVLLIGAEINSEVDFEVTGLPRGSTDFRTAIPPDIRQPTA